MSVATFFVSEAAVRNLKRKAERRVDGVSSSHLSEGIAAALGFNTYAALRSALAGRPTAEVQKPDNARLVQRLTQLGYTPPPNLEALPTLKHSYFPFRRDPLRTTRSARWLAWRNLVVAAINAGLDQHLFGLSPEENWWPGGAAESHSCHSYVYRFQLEGLGSVVASVDAISGDELSLCVVLNPRRPDLTPHFMCELESGDAVATCWLERQLGAWIQDGGEDFHCRRKVKDQLASLDLFPKGYSDQGSFIA